MKIRIKLYATLRKHLPDVELGEETIIDVSRGTTIKDVMDKLGIDEEEVKIILVNGTHNKIEYELQKDDLLVIFPPIGGG